MKIYIDKDADGSVLIVKTETPDEATVLNCFDLELGKLIATIHHTTAYGRPYLRIKKEKTCEPQVPNP